MSNYLENGIAGKTAKVGGVAGLLIGAFDGLFGAIEFGILGYLGGYVAGGIADLFSYGDEKSAKKSNSNDLIYKELTA